MSMKTLAADELVATTDEPTDEQPRVLDWGTEQPVELPGGDVVFVDAYTRTDDGHALRFDGDVPVATTSVYSERDLRAALLDAGYERRHVDIALDNKLTGEQGRQAAAIAEGRTQGHDAELVTDGGQTAEALPGNHAVAGSETAVDHDGVWSDEHAPGCDTCGGTETIGRKTARLPDGMLAEVCDDCYACLPGRWETSGHGYDNERVGR